MKKMKMYESSDKMLSLIRDNYSILQSLGAFGISLGFGNKTVQEVCQEQNVDTLTFLAVVNLTINDYFSSEDLDKLSVPTLLQYLKAYSPIATTVTPSITGGILRLFTFLRVPVTAIPPGTFS